MTQHTPTTDAFGREWPAMFTIVEFTRPHGRKSEGLLAATTEAANRALELEAAGFSISNEMLTDAAVFYVSDDTLEADLVTHVMPSTIPRIDRLAAISAWVESLSLDKLQELRQTWERANARPI